MFRFQVTNKSLLRFAVVTLLGMVVALGNPFTLDAKEKISKRALQEMIAGAKSAADHKAIADYYYAEAAKAQAKAVEHDEMAGWYRKAGEGVKKTPYAPGTIDHPFGVQSPAKKGRAICGVRGARPGRRVG